ncbi:GIY-YIG nuclease family protein [Candidatus Omnitrophota bacterium]
MWYVYILRCKGGTLYTGSTTDICRRIKEHNTGKGGSYTRIHKPVEIIYKEFHQNRSDAQAREAQIKRWTKKKKLALITHNKPLLKELSKSRD